MSFFEKPNLGADPKLSTGPDSNTLDVIGADYEAGRVTFNLNAEDIAGEEAYDRVIDQVEELLPGRGKDFANPYRRDPWDMKLDAFGKSLRSPYNPRRLVLENEKDKFWAHYNQIQMDLERYPEAFGLDPNSPERVALPSQDHSRALKSVVDDKLALQADIRSRASGAENFAGGVIGGLGAAGTDPMTYLTAFVPAGSSRTILGATVKGAIANAAIETTLQPAVASWHADLGLDYSLGDATANVAFAALFGGAFEGGGRAIGSAVFGSPDFREAKARLQALPDDHVLRQALSGKRADVIKAGRKLQDALPPEGRRALDLEARTHDAEAAVPDRVPPRAHADALNDADIAARDPEMGMPAREAAVPETQTPRYYSEAVPAERGRIYEDDGKPVRTDRFRLSELETDAEAFQYKGGGDTKGVTGRLQGVETWSPLAAGEVMVWERGDGRRFIADGHQRAGLARRLEQNAETRKDPVASSEQQVLDAVTADLERVANATDRKAVQANALLHTAQISTLARRIGMDPKQFYDRHGAKILEGDGEADPGGGVLTQKDELYSVGPDGEASIVQKTLDELLADPTVTDFERRMNAVPATVADDMTQDALATAGRSYSVDGQRVEFGGAIDHLRKTAEAYAGGPVKAGRQVTIVIGPPAAGKSTISEAYAKAASAAIVDPDDAKLVIPEYDGGVGGNAVHKESKLLAGEVLAGMIDRGANLVLPRIGSKQKELEILVRGFKSEGYEIAIVRVDVAPDEAARRMISRFRQTNRLVPTEYFRTIGDGPKRALAGLNKEGIRYAEIDFNGPKGVADIIDGDPKLAGILRKQGFRSGQGHRAGNRGNVRGRQAAAGGAGADQNLKQAGRPKTPRLGTDLGNLMKEAAAGDAAVARVTGDPAAIAQAMTNSGASTEEVFKATGRIMLMRNGRKVHFGSGGMTADEVVQAFDFWMAKPEAQRPEWVRTLDAATSAPTDELAQRGRAPDLPQDETSRMARAKADGFDTDTVLYHGSPAIFDSFIRGDGVYGFGVYFSPDKARAEQYGKNVGSYYVRGNIASSEQVARWFEETGDNWGPARKAREAGYTGIRLGDDQVLIFDPVNIRSKFAEFDPAQSASADLLAQQGTRGSFDPANNLVRLTAARDVSTFMHEGAHWYLDVLDRLAEGGNSHPFVREQLDAVYQWHGVKKGFRAYDAAGNVTPEGRELHEAFAETFEAYLRNGEAPSAALKGVFEQFREWLAQIYASLTGLERARLTPEIKAVFDRMLATDPELKGLPRNADPAAGGIQANGYLFREADGWTPEEVRGKAAKANIQKGSGDVTDTALAFREFPGMVDNSLPVSSQHISQARALASLDPDVFGMVRNGILKPEHAAVIGRYVPEQSRHKAVAQAVIEAGPTNADQARFVVRAAIEAGFRGDVQETLFGLQQFQTSMLKDKMKLTGDTLAKLRSDKRVFSLLEAEADRIQAAGNTLDRSANASKAEASAVVEDIVLRLATRKGPISDMFNAELAAMADGTTTRAAAAGRLADALRARFDEDGISAFTEAPRPVREILPDPDKLTGDDVPTPEDVDALAVMADTDTGDMFNTVPGDDGAVRKPGDALRALDRQIASLTACAYPGATS